MKGKTHFRGIEHESNPAISANIHVLGALLRQQNFTPQHPTIQKIVRFLRASRREEKYWIDKWHTSPYYPTGHAVTLCTGFFNELVADAVQWIQATQNTDGSWGFYGPTAEETAYCLQALAVWKRANGNVPLDILQRGASWLAANAEPPYSWLWIGKCLYCPELVVRSAIVTALSLVKEHLHV
jgi:halimadienyl-diphosphate synthase